MTLGSILSCNKMGSNYCWWSNVHGVNGCVKLSILLRADGGVQMSHSMLLAVKCLTSMAVQLMAQWLEHMPANSGILGSIPGADFVEEAFFLVNLVLENGLQTIETISLTWT